MSSFERLGAAASAVAAPTATALRGRRHGDDRLYLLVRDPRRLYATWEISASLAARAVALAATRGAPVRVQLRVERAATHTETVRETLSYDLPDAVNGEGWYVDLPNPGGAARALIGLDLPGGFEALLVSRWTEVPPDGPCAEEGTWDLDADAAAWLEREEARQRAAKGVRVPSSATRYLTPPPPPSDRA